MTPGPNEPPAGFQLCFRRLSAQGKDYKFPCDEKGCVNLDALGASRLNDYLVARNAIGREFAAPEVEPFSMEHWYRPG
jgi:hypothetical protein